MLTPLSELDVINIVLGNSQLSPVDSLESGDIDAEVAKSILDESSVDVQARGWAWNTEIMTLTPNLEGYLSLPANTLEVDPVDKSLKVVQRGSKLYDLENNTYRFSGSLKVRLIVALDFELLPQSVRRYLAMKTSRLFQARMLGDNTLRSEISNEEQLAWAELIKSDIRTKDGNHIYGGPVSAGMKSRVRSRIRRYV